MWSIIFIVATVIMFLNMLYYAYGIYLYRQEEESFQFITHLVATIITAMFVVLGIFLVCYSFGVSVFGIAYVTEELGGNFSIPENLVEIIEK